MYRINEVGLEVEYFNIAMANIKITAITPNLHPAGMTSTHLEDIDFRYETITGDTQKGTSCIVIHGTIAVVHGSK